MMLYRGITVTYEAIRGWCLKFAQGYANQIRKQRPQAGDKWHLDEVVIKIKGEQFYLWRAVDQHGTVLDPHHHKQTASEYRETMRQRMESWRSLTGLSMIA